MEVDHPMIIAEISGNHNGSLETARELIFTACRVGCDAVKIQTYEPEELQDPANNHIYEKCKIPPEWFGELFDTAKSVGIILFSSVFSVRAVEFLERFKCPAYKIASPESTRLSEQTYIDIKNAIRRTGKRFVASTGIEDYEFINGLGADLLFYCVAGYPATVDDRHIDFFANSDCDGFSDHTNGLIAPLAMIGAGATLIEKHFKLSEDCVDAAFSFNPQQMKQLCDIAHR